MADFDIAWLIRELDRFGIKLTATRLLDGSFGLNRWRSMSYWANAARADALWAAHVGDDADVMREIAAFIGAASSHIVEASAPHNRPLAG